MGLYFLSIATGVVADAVFKVGNDPSARIAGLYSPAAYCLAFVLYRIFSKKLRTSTTSEIIEQAGQLSKTGTKTENHDQARQAKLAIRARDRHACDAALNHLTDLDLLAKVAIKARDKYVRLHAVRKITDQPMLAQLAIQSKHSDVRDAAVKRLKNQRQLAKVATKARLLTAKAAAKRITDQSILKGIATREKDSSIRWLAIDAIDDFDLLRHIAKHDKDEMVREAAENNIRKLEALSPTHKSIRDLEGFEQKEFEKMLGHSNFNDIPESRTPETFEKLARVMKIIDEDPAQCLSLCSKQIVETPDYDMPYIWKSNIQHSMGDTDASFEILTKGLKACKRVSAVLSKLGERSIDKGNPVLSATSFQRAILAQNPKQCLHDPYLYFSYICRYSQYGNAGEKMLRTARKIFGPGIDLTQDVQAEIENLVSRDMEYMQPLVQALVAELIASGILD